MTIFENQKGVSSSEGGVTGGEGTEAHTDGSVGSGAGDVDDHAFRHASNKDWNRVSDLQGVPPNDRPAQGIEGFDEDSVFLGYDALLQALRRDNRL